MLQRRAVVHSDLYSGGTSALAGTRVSAKALLDYLEGRHPLCVNKT